MRISDWSSDVCSAEVPVPLLPHAAIAVHVDQVPCGLAGQLRVGGQYAHVRHVHSPIRPRGNARDPGHPAPRIDARLLAKARSEEHTSELQSLMRISYAVFCLTKQTTSIKS